MLRILVPLLLLNCPAFPEPDIPRTSRRAATKVPEDGARPASAQEQSEELNGEKQTAVGLFALSAALLLDIKKPAQQAIIFWVSATLLIVSLILSLLTALSFIHLRTSPAAARRPRFVNGGVLFLIALSVFVWTVGKPPEC